MITSKKTSLTVVNDKLYVKVKLHGVSRKDAIEKLEEILGKVKETVVE